MTESPDSASRRECQDDSVPDLAPVPTNTLDQRAHEIGMISIGFNADQKYIGPSSGYFLARLLLANSRRTGDLAPSMSSRLLTTTQSSIDELVSAAQGPLLLPSKHVAVQLAQVYFETIQPQYPFLHEGSFRAALDRIYRNGAPVDFGGNDDGCIYFQSYMVLAISATVLKWRTKRHIPGESYCLSALRYLDCIRLGTSIEGLQCMLLLLLFTMYSPHMQLNVWNLNYQCLAAVIDLGLQRHVAISAGISQLEQDMRTRIFWTVFTIDRTIATMMGRPIGLRDEACELRLPQVPTDVELTTHPDHANGRSHSMTVSIHLFKLAKLNSEIKYVANSVVRDVPTYAYPAMRDVSAWQSSMMQQLDDWLASIPQIQLPNDYITLICQLRCFSVKMLLLRPSPAIPSPTGAVLTACHASARQSLRLYEQLYKSDLIAYDWMTLHGVVYSTITALYCTRAVREIAQRVSPEDLMEDMSVSLSILSATGEHWSGAKRARDILEDLGKLTIRLLRRSREAPAQRQAMGQAEPNVQSLTVDIGDDTQVNQLMGGAENDCPMSGLAQHTDLFSDMQLDLGSFPELQQNQELFGDTVNIDDMMRNLFDDFIPPGQNFY
ncbi:unnamed protein product [Alternaria alternata]